MSADDRLQAWLASQGLDDLFEVLRGHDIDTDILDELDHELLKELGLSLGQRLRLLKCVRAATHGSSSQPTTPPTTPPTTLSTSMPTTLPAAVPAESARPPRHAERRMVTVMFCDLVDSSSFVSRQDAEVVRDMLNACRVRIREVSQRHNGYVAQYLGDGSLIYFGYPEAGEDDAERAVEAGLALLDLFRAPVQGADLSLPSLRVGIASGRAVVDELHGDAESGSISVVGQITYLAARLQQMAQPDSLYIDGKTRRLVGERFDCRFHGESVVKGFDSRIPVYEVESAKSSRSRFAAIRGGVRGELVGRENEVAHMHGLWQRAKSGEGQMLLLTGEPGIGKSRTVWQFADAESRAGIEVDAFQCSSYHQHTPLYPFVEAMRQRAGDGIAASAGSRPAWLRQLLEADEPAAASGGGDPRQQRDRMIEALQEYLLVRDDDGAGIVVLEDLHWCDPTSLEMLDGLLEKLRSHPVLILATARPEFDYPFQGHSNLSSLSLNRLGPQAVQAMMARQLGTERLPGELVELVKTRTDGIPLFVEEFVSALLESGHVSVDGDAVSLCRQIDWEQVPDTLQASLMSRLDKLGDYKSTVQLAACIGRTFSHGLLERIGAVGGAPLHDALASLAQCGLLFRIADDDGGRYTFKHALVRDVAYGSLLRAERRNSHRRIAETLSVQRALGARVGPELLAHHRQEAGEWRASIDAWREAAAHAAGRSANAEAAAHLRKALALMADRDGIEDADALELALLLDLASPVRALTGFASPEIAEVTARAVALADRVQSPDSILTLLYTDWVHHFVTGHRRECLALAQAMADKALQSGDLALTMTASRALGASCFTMGRLDDAVMHFDHSLALYREADQDNVTRLVGLDSRVVCLGYQALCLWNLERAPEAYRAIDEAVRHAECLGHASTQAFARYHHTLLYGILEKDAGHLVDGGAALAAIGEDNDFRLWAVCGRLLVSLGEAIRHPRPDTLERAEAMLQEFADMGVVYRPSYAVLLAEICAELGEVERGLRHLQAARSLVVETGEQWSDGALQRAEALLRRRS